MDVIYKDRTALQRDTTVEEFAETNSLTMVVTKHGPCRYTASFDNCETKESAASGILESPYGDGQTANLAILDYANK